MADTEPSYVQVPVDSTGKKMRNIQVSVLQPDGSLAVTQMEVVVVANSQGQPLDFDGLDAVLQAQARTNELLELILKALGG